MEDEDRKTQIKRSSPFSDSGVVNHRGFERTRGVCRGLWVSKLGRHPPPGHPLIHHGRRPPLCTTNKRQAVWATCHRAFNCLFLSFFLPLSLFLFFSRSLVQPHSQTHTHTPFLLLSLPLSSTPVAFVFLPLYSSFFILVHISSSFLSISQF